MNVFCIGFYNEINYSNAKTCNLYYNRKENVIKCNELIGIQWKKRSEYF